MNLIYAFHKLINIFLERKMVQKVNKFKPGSAIRKLKKAKFPGQQLLFSSL